MSEFNVKPCCAELIVRDPETRKPLSEDGEIKPRNPYWMRRIQDGSVQMVAAKKGRKS